MYDDDDGTRAVLLIRPTALERDTEMSAHTSGAECGYSWAQRGIGYSVGVQAIGVARHRDSGLRNKTSRVGVVGACVVY
jgi:hypothetical protein